MCFKGSTLYGKTDVTKCNLLLLTYNLFVIYLGNMILILIFAVVGGMVVLVVVTITACIACRRKQLKSEVKL